MASKQYKNNIFSFASESAKNISLINADLYICPICGNRFERNDIDTNILTIEHVPQRQLGGKGFILTCTNCNTKILSKVDNELIQRERSILPFQKIILDEILTPQSIVLKINDIKLNAMISSKEANVTINIDEENNNPKMVNQYSEVMNAFNPKYDKMEITSTNFFRERLANIAELKNAFLYCFALFGYSYALDFKNNEIRKQLYYPQEEIIDFFWFGKRKEEESLFGIYKSEIPIRHFAIYQYRSKVVLPCFLDSVIFYKNFKKILEEKRNTKYQYDSFWNFPDKLLMLIDRKHT